MGNYERAAAFLSDGEWHSTREISEATGIPVQRLHRALTIAEKHRCVERGDIVMENSRYTRMWRLQS